MDSFLLWIISNTFSISTQCHSTCFEKSPRKANPNISNVAWVKVMSVMLLLIWWVEFQSRGKLRTADKSRGQWHDMACTITVTKYCIGQNLNSQNTPRSLPVRATYGVCFGSILLDNDRKKRNYTGEAFANMCKVISNDLSLQLSIPVKTAPHLFNMPQRARSKLLLTKSHISTLRPRQNGRHFADDIFRLIFLNENVKI